MPKLRLSLFHRCIKCLVFLHLNNETNLSGVAEVGYGETADFVDKRLTGKLEFVLALLDQVLELVRLELHYASDAQL